MASWQEIRNHLAFVYPPVAEDEGVTLVADDVVIEVRPVEAFGRPWLEVALVLGRIAEHDVLRFLEADLAVGAPARVGELLLLRHRTELAPLSGLAAVRLLALLVEDVRRLRDRTRVETCSPFAHYA